VKDKIDKRIDGMKINNCVFLLEKIDQKVINIIEEPTNGMPNSIFENIDNPLNMPKAEIKINFLFLNDLRRSSLNKLIKRKKIVILGRINLIGKL